MTKIKYDKKVFNKVFEQLPREENVTGGKPFKNYGSIVLTVTTGFIVIKARKPHFLYCNAKTIVK